MAQVVQLLPSKCEALNSNANTTTTTTPQKRREELGESEELDGFFWLFLFACLFVVL
jgi:hypothetical protein